MNAIIYYRDRKGGKSLQFQQNLATAWCEQRNVRIVGQVIESESGRKRANRPELDRALRLAKIAKAILFIPTFGQMSRNADVIGKMLNHGVEVCTPDVASLREPCGTKSVLKVMASVAEFEVEETKARAKKAYQKIQQEINETGSHTTRTGKVITSLGHASTTKLAAAEATKARLAKKLDYTAEILPIMQTLYDRGCRSAGDFAKSLTAKKILSPQGRPAWTASMARNVMTNCAIAPTPKMSLETHRHLRSVEQISQASLAPTPGHGELLSILRQAPDTSIERLKRKFGFTYGEINRAREALSAEEND